MKFKLENPQHQETAIQSVVAVFNGMERNTFDNAHDEDIHLNVCSLSDSQIHTNIQRIIQDNNVAASQSFITDENDACIEMETGTGKTLTYIQTAYELFRQYGLSKFIILVPSVPIRQGVIDTFDNFKEQLADKYDISQYVMHPQYVSDLFNTSEQDSKRIATDYLQRTKHALIIFVQNVIESYYRAFCTALALKTSHNFTKVYESLFNHFNIPTDSEWGNANKMLAKIRNTLHNNGIHTMPDETIYYHGTEYIFSNNRLHHAAGYESIIFMISDLIDFSHQIGSGSSNISLIDNNGFVDYNNITW